MINSELQHSASANRGEISPTPAGGPGEPTRRAPLRSSTKLIRFTHAELAAVTSRAAAAGRPVACFIRECAIGQKPKVRPGTLGDAVVHQLGRTATRLAALSACAKAAGLPSATDFDDALHDLLDVIRGIE